jgi:hypothetical protein
MAVIDHFGELSTAQDLTNGAVDSENVVDLGAVANVGHGQVWLDIVCETAIGGSAGTTSTFTFNLVVASEAALNTVRSVIQIYIANDVADPRIAAANRQIACVEIGQYLGDVADATYRYLGLISTLVDGNGTAAVSINAALSTARPRTKDNVQVIRSNVTVPS